MKSDTSEKGLESLIFEALTYQEAEKGGGEAHQAREAGPMLDAETATTGEFDEAQGLQLGQHARDRLDGEPQIVGHVLASHRQGGKLAAEAVGDVEPEAGDLLAGGLATEKHQVLLGAFQFLGRGRPDHPFHPAAVLAVVLQRRTLHD